MSPKASPDAVRAALDAYVDPYLQDTLGAAQAVREVREDGEGFRARIALGFPVGGDQAELAAPLVGHLAAAGLTPPPPPRLGARPRPPPPPPRLNPPRREPPILAGASRARGGGQAPARRDP